MTKVNQNVSRRSFMQLSGGAAAASALIGLPTIARGAGKDVVIVGGGPAGATAARYLRMIDPSVKVTLIEANATYHTCFMSNEVIGDLRTMESISTTYDGLKSAGVNVVQDMVTSIDTKAKKVMTKGGNTYSYERCIVAPGIDFKYELTDGYDAKTAETITHAWKAGPQTATLAKQVKAMDDGGVVCIVAPPNPFRCPPGPYERASLIANYMKKHKPKSKVIIFDSKDKFSKQGLFTQAWKKFYGFGTDNAMIEWMPAAKLGKINAIHAKDMVVETDFEQLKAAVINFIPAQKAGKIAFAAGLTDKSGWCPVKKLTFESSMVPNVHVLGDASIATKMPKSGYSANSQGKWVAQAVVALLNGKQPGVPSFVNTCYSRAADDWAFSVAAVYKLNMEKNLIGGVKGAGGLSPMDASAEDRKREVAYGHSWYNNIKKDIWG
ncbi:MAG: NAD(P)/FAD-dependent oxidoreductase [Rhodospirillales bacterium]|nr:NAD(P)/FAD-dependent oxidoreductase [Rhodospirillales bacterium]